MENVKWNHLVIQVELLCLVYSDITRVMSTTTCNVSPLVVDIHLQTSDGTQ